MSHPDPGVAPALSDRGFQLFNAALSSVALAFLAWLLLGHRGDGGRDLAFMPALNAGLNALAASLLVAGWVAIRRRALRAHRFFMVSAFATSGLFLVSYVIYHYAHGDSRYPGTGAMRAVYLSVLASHVLLSLAVVPLVLTALYHALRGRFERHRRVTRWALPVWLYVSITGVAIFFLLRAAQSP